MAFIYILHFDTPLAHAQHYTGCTEAIQERLNAHANGAGSHLTRVLAAEGIGWRMGALMQCSKYQMRRLERHLKNIANAGRYCRHCAKLPARLPGTQHYPFEELPFTPTSAALADQSGILPFTIVRPIKTDEPQETMEAIRELMRRDMDALGFIPAGGKEGLSRLLRAGLIVIAKRAGEVVGYLAYTITRDRTTATIHQCCVRDDSRLNGLGRRLVAAVRTAQPEAILLAKVRDDLAANHFWPAVGFAKAGEQTHPKSKRRINLYQKLPVPSKPANEDMPF